MPWQPVPVAKHQVEARRFSRLSLPVSSLLQVTGYSPVDRTVLVSMHEQVLLTRCHGSWRPQLFRPNRTKDTLTFSNQVAGTSASKRKRKQSLAGLVEECLHRIPRGVTLSPKRKSNSVSQAATQTPSTGVRHPSLEEGDGKRCSECGCDAVTLSLAKRLANLSETTKEAAKLND